MRKQIEQAKKLKEAEQGKLPLHVHQNTLMKHNESLTSLKSDSIVEAFIEEISDSEGK